MKSASAALFLLLLLSAERASASPSCSIQGVWQGRLGQTPITLEMDAESGRYRYRESLNDLLLKPRQRASNTWDEYDSQGNQTGSLKLACDGDSVNGIWSGPAGKTAPITMQRGQSYEGNRVKQAALKVLSKKVLSGRTLQFVSIKGLEELQTLQIANATPSEAEVNRALRAALDKAVENHLGCVSAGYTAGRFQDPYGDELSVQPVFWRDGLLSTSSNYSGYCGGARPYHELSYSVFDTRKGIEVPIDSWIANDQKKQQAIPHTSALGQIIWRIALQGKPDVAALPAQDQECLSSLREPDAALASLEPHGMGFRYWYPYAQSDCVENYVVPWKKLKRFLSTEGRQYVEQLQKP